MIRLFVAIALPAALRQQLTSLASGIPNARWTPEENLHVTVRFIGEVDETTADGIHAALSEVHVPAFPLTVSGIGTFEAGRRDFTLWAGVERSAPLVRLRDKVESALVRAGVPPERRRFQPHVTLARLKDPPLPRLQAFVAGHNLFRQDIAVDEFVLFSSHLGHGEPIYTAEAEYPLDIIG
jgi:RNA 2',3'-cyclic 3'-phosphodiesterase